MWLDEEIKRRESQGRPWLSVNCLKPAVDQVEGDIRENPPGPKILPVGGGADNDTAAIHAGLIRECEHRSNAQIAYITAARYQSASGLGVIELATEYTNDRSDSQQVTILTAEDPAMYFWDPAARMLGRQDAMWAGKIKVLGEAAYIAQFGDKRAVLKNRGIQTATGWLQDFIGLDSAAFAQINAWTGSGKGPYTVCEFCQIEVERVKLFAYSDNVNRFEDEEAPEGVTPGELLREVPRRTIWKWLVDALEVLDDPTEWLGTVCPYIPVLGQEIWIDGKLYRFSLISEALPSNRGLNFAATTCTEIVGLIPKSPYVGWKGQFEDERWQSANTEAWATLELTPAWAVHPTTGQAELLPAPQRNLWEAALEAPMQLANFFIDRIKATTNIWDPSLGNAKHDQSGVAISQLRSESSTGTFFVADNLHHAIQEVYEQIIIINSQIRTSAEVASIVQPDSTHEAVSINQLFPKGVDPASGKQRKPVFLNPTQRHAITVTVGPNFDVLKQQTTAILTEFLKIDPQIMAVPGVASKALRAISQGDPEIESIADLLDPDTSVNPAQMQQQLGQARKQIQAYETVIAKLKMDLDSKTPQVQADLRKNVLDNLTRIEVAKINASLDADKQQADMIADHLGTVLGMAHETATQTVEHEHEKGMAQMTAAHDAALAAQSAQQTSQQSAQDAAQTAALQPDEGETE